MRPNKPRWQIQIPRWPLNKDHLERLPLLAANRRHAQNGTVLERMPPASLLLHLCNLTPSRRVAVGHLVLCRRSSEGCEGLRLALVVIVVERVGPGCVHVYPVCLACIFARCPIVLAHLGDCAFL